MISARAPSSLVTSTVLATDRYTPGVPGENHTRARHVGDRVLPRDHDAVGNPLQEPAGRVEPQTVVRLVIALRVPPSQADIAAGVAERDLDRIVGPRAVSCHEQRTQRRRGRVVVAHTGERPGAPAV